MSYVPYSKKTWGSEKLLHEDLQNIEDGIAEIDEVLVSLGANSLLKADTASDPVPLSVGTSTIVGRKSSGGIDALTPAEVRSIINVADGANNYTHPSTIQCNANNYSHPSSRQCSSGTWAWGSISGKPSCYSPCSHTHGGGDITSTVSNADKVDGCDAGIVSGKVYKIHTGLAQGEIFYVDSIPAINKLGHSPTNGYQLTENATGNPYWAAASDLIFSDTHCPKCGKRFETGDTLVLYVVGHNEVGDMLTIPMHKDCAEAPKKTVTIKRKVFEDRHVLDELTGKTKIQRVQKTQKKTVTKHKLKEGYELDHKTGKAIKIGPNSKHDLSIALETVEDVIEEPIYEDVEYVI